VSLAIVNRHQRSLAGRGHFGGRRGLAADGGGGSFGPRSRLGFMFVPQSWSISPGYSIYSLNSSDQRHIFGVPKLTAVWEPFVTYLERIQRETLDATEASCLDGREGPSPGIYQ
jgi:hypothetical protein